MLKEKEYPKVASYDIDSCVNLAKYSKSSVYI